ncbi:fatty acid desaturase family protein [Streptomyces sp. NPDC001674]|uniref:fatty acid desaturase family protein n=1 Tax=Streptomyces sp. NPDC001674 TaxID=3154394 RepID=UPI00331E9A5B
MSRKQSLSQTRYIRFQMKDDTGRSFTMVQPGADLPARHSDLYMRGFRNPPELRALIADAHNTKVFRTGASALADQLSVVLLLLAATSPAARELGQPLAVLILLIAVLIAARQLRALENLVHEASHYNWSRHHRTLNDVLSAVLAATPTGASIKAYRESHLLHHGRFGTRHDPDRQRYEQLALEDLDRSGVLRYIGNILRRFIPYQRGWIKATGSAPLISLLPFGWALVTVVTPALVLDGARWALSAAGAWLFAYLIALPLLRFVAESSEHNYRGTDSVLAATISNFGTLQRLVIHPHGDGYHTIHHLWPGVPHHRLAALHRELLAESVEYREQIRYRTGVLQRPQTGIPDPRLPSPRKSDG